MSTTSLYTPILKGKINDLKALGKMPTALARRTFPLIELLAPGDDESIDQSSNRFANQLQKYYSSSLCSVDLHSISPGQRMSDGSRSLEMVCATLCGMKLPFVPVFGFDHEPELWGRIAPIPAHYGRGITFRLKFDDIETAEDTVSEIIERLHSAKISPKDTNLLLDLSSLFGHNDSELVSLRGKVQDFIDQAMSTSDFNVISVIGSSMPKDVNTVPKEGQLAYHRREMPLWLDTASNMPDISLSFGDYGIVHPNFSDKIIATNANAKIRYTRRLHHHIFRGHSLKEGEKYGQYRELSSRVLGSSIYIDRDHSYGDDYVWRCAHGEAGTGNLGTWVEVDMNHHLVCVSAQLPRILARLASGAEAAEALAISA